MVICKFEKCKPNAKEITRVCTYIVYYIKIIIGNKLKIGNKRNRKTTFIFWNFKTKKFGKIGPKSPQKSYLKKNRKKET
jgi:hypothetical protein